MYIGVNELVTADVINRIASQFNANIEILKTMLSFNTEHIFPFPSDPLCVDTPQEI